MTCSICKEPVGLNYAAVVWHMDDKNGTKELFDYSCGPVCFQKLLLVLLQHEVEIKLRSCSGEKRKAQKGRK